MTSQADDDGNTGRKARTIAITGANSAVGNNLLHHVADRADTHVVACVRSAHGAASLPVSPRISPCVIDYDDRDGLAAALTGASCAVHLAGILMESPSSNYQVANVDATRAVVEACKSAGVGQVLLISVLGADPDSANRFLRSKGQAERIVVESGISAAIIRTPILLGPRTAGGRAVVHAASQRTVTLLGGGRHSIRPLDVDDLSRAILGCCGASRSGTAIYELVGPEAVTYRDVVARTAKLMGGNVLIRSMPVWLARLGAAVTGLKRQGGMTPTVIEVITSNEAVRRNADAELGIALSPLAATLEKLLPSRANVWHQ